MEKKIHWIKWRDPLAHLVTPGDLDDDEDLELHAAKDSFIDEDEKVEKDRPKRGSTGPAVMGPMGIIPLHEENTPSKLFNFWMGHTNFNLDHEARQVISSVPGIETLDIFTRYRFRVAIGKSFNQKTVKAAVDAAFKNIQPPAKPEIRKMSPLERMQKMLAKKFKFWSIGIMPNGSHEIAGGESIEDVNSKSQLFEQSAKSVVKSWELQNAVTTTK